MYKTNTTVGYTVSFSVIKSTFMITGFVSSQRFPYRTAWSNKQKRDKFNFIFEKARGSILIKPRQLETRYHKNVTIERNLVVSPWGNIYSSVNLPNFNDLQVLPPFWKESSTLGFTTDSLADRSKTIRNKSKSNLNVLQFNCKWKRMNRSFSNDLS